VNWEIVGATGEWFGSLAIIVTLVYLARQIKVASMQFKKQVEGDISTRAFQAYDPIYEGRNGEIMETGLNRPDDLNSTDYFIFDLLMHRQLGAVGELERSLDLGYLTEDLIQGMAVHYQGVIFDKPGAIRWVLQNPQHVGTTLESVGIAVEREAN
jgi:hypothetical protein